MHTFIHNQLHIHRGMSGNTNSCVQLPCEDSLCSPISMGLELVYWPYEGPYFIGSLCSLIFTFFPFISCLQSNSMGAPALGPPEVPPPPPMQQQQGRVMHPLPLACFLSTYVHVWHDPCLMHWRAWFKPQMRAPINNRNEAWFGWSLKLGSQYDACRAFIYLLLWLHLPYYVWCLRDQCFRLFTNPLF